MSKVKSNFIYQVLFDIFKMILPLVTSPYIARVMGAEGIGIYSYTYSIVSYFILFADLGISTFASREIAYSKNDREKLDKTFSNLFYLHLFISTIVIGIYLMYVQLIAEYKTFGYLQVFHLIASAVSVSWLYIGIEEFKATVFRSTAFKIITLICIFIFVHDSNDLWVYIFIMSFGVFLSEGILWVKLKKYVSFVKPDLALMARYIKPMFILFLPAIGSSILHNMDKIMIGMMVNKEEVGFYENAQKALILRNIISSLCYVLRPRISNLISEGNYEQANFYINKSFKYAGFFSISIGFAIATVSKDFSIIFWGKNFEYCGLLMKILCISLPFWTVTSIIRDQWLLPQKKDYQYMNSVLAAAVLNFILNIFMVPKSGAIGASIATVLTEIFVCIMMVMNVRKKISITSIATENAIYIIFGLIMCIGTSWILDSMKGEWVRFVLEIIIGGVIYAVLCCCYWIIKKDNDFIGFFKKIKSRK